MELTTKSGAKADRSIISVLRKGFEYEIFQDLHEHVYERFSRPSLIFMVDDRDTTNLSACFPRKRTPTPKELFHKLTSITAHSRSVAVIEDYEMKIAEELLCESQEGRARWGWQSSGRGLVDLYLPVVTVAGFGRDDSIAGVLVLGKYRTRGLKSLDSLRAWIDRITLGDLAEKYLPTYSSQERKKYQEELRALVEQVPVLTAKERKQVEYEVDRALALMKRFLTRTLESGFLFGGQELLTRLVTTHPSLGVTAPELWSTVQANLKKILSALPLESAVAFASSESDFTELRRMAVVGAKAATDEVLSFAAYEEFRTLEQSDWTNIPRHSGPLSWVNSRNLLGTDSGTVFCKEFAGGYLVLLGFGLNERLTPSQRTTLYDAITSRVFPYIEAAYSAIELDALMAETGHLMGRAVGKVHSGYEVLMEVSPQRLENAEGDRQYQLARWAIEDGVMRLELIRQNFYSFAGQRRQVDDRSLFDPAFGESFDVVKVLNSMRSFFDRAIEESELKDLHYRLSPDPLVVKGHSESLRTTFLNLFDNALKFSWKNTFITIQLYRDDGECVFTIQNLGLGVPQAETKLVFKRLRKASYRDPLRRIEGLGLGLPYCKRVIELIFSGSIRLKSRKAETPNPRRFKGDNWLTEVVVRIPLVQ